MSKAAKRILWAIDAFESPEETFNNAVRFLNALSRSTALEVQPVYLMSPEQLNLSIEFAPAFEERYLPAARKALSKLLADTRIEGLKEPEILIQKRPSLKASVERLARYAGDNGFEAIVAGSHGRGGLSRLFLGSFAEQLLMSSKVPVIVVGARAQSLDRRIDRILFPTDLGEDSLPAFRKALALARSLDAGVTVVHSLPNPVEAVYQSGVYLISGGWVPYPVHLNQERTEADAILKRWEAAAREAGVPFHKAIDIGAPNAADSIIRTARAEGTQLIAMAARSGPIESALLGSVTRQVVRASPCPVWVLHLPD